MSISVLGFLLRSPPPVGANVDPLYLYMAVMFAVLVGTLVFFFVIPVKDSGMHGTNGKEVWQKFVTGAKEWRPHCLPTLSVISSCTWAISCATLNCAQEYKILCSVPSFVLITTSHSKLPKPCHPSATRLSLHAYNTLARSQCQGCRRWFTCCGGREWLPIIKWNCLALMVEMYCVSCFTAMPFYIYNNDWPGPYHHMLHVVFHNHILSAYTTMAGQHLNSSMPVCARLSCPILFRDLLYV